MKFEASKAQIMFSLKGLTFPEFMIFDLRILPGKVIPLMSLMTTLKYFNKLHVAVPHQHSMVSKKAIADSFDLCWV